MSVMSIEEVKKLIDKLENKNKLGTSDAMMYFVSPFLQSLGYNTFDVDTVDVKNYDGEVYAQISPDLTFVVTLDGNYPEAGEQNRMHLSLDLKGRMMKLYFKVLDNWEEIVRIDLKTDKPDKYITQLTKKLTREQVINSYKAKGEKFLTENVFDSKVEAGKWDNDFMLLGLLSELKNPSPEFTNLMAKRMNKEYTTKDPEWISKHISDMEKEGLLALIGKLYNRGEIPTDSEVESSSLSSEHEEREKDTETNDEELVETQSYPDSFESKTETDSYREEELTFDSDSTEGDDLTFGSDSTGGDDLTFGSASTGGDDLTELTFGEDKEHNTTEDEIEPFTFGQETSGNALGFNLEEPKKNDDDSNGVQDLSSILTK